MIAERPQIPRLPLGTGPDESVPLADLDRFEEVGITRLSGRVDQVGHLGRGDRPLAAVQDAQLLKHLARLLDAIALALNADLAVPGQYLDPQRIADLPKVLVTAAEDGQFLVVTIQADGDVRHSSPRAGSPGLSSRSFAKSLQAHRHP